MQKLLNDPSHAVQEYVRGFGLAHPHIVRVNESPCYIARVDAPRTGKVTIISGTGSGHEPLNSGYVGMGMLDAACLGPIFTSPAPNQYFAAIDATNGGAGIVLVVKNYAGGVLNTEVVMEMAEAQGLTIASVLVRDDVAVPDANRRRGMGAAVFVSKIVGAAAEAGYDLDRVAAIGRHASAQSASMGVALSGCTSPMVGYPTFQLPPGQMELGVGIHGEAGRERVAIAPSDEIVERLLPPILANLELNAGEQVLAMVSGMGGTPLQELYIFYHHLHRALRAMGIRVRRSLVGNYITSLDMAGAAISLMRLDDELLRLWDAPVATAELHW